MSEALELAARARGRTSPNPMVGAVVVRDGRVVGRGWHHRAGEAHAEVLALNEAGERARGAALILNLEPCSHFGRTPPCAPFVAESGVAEVYVAMEDPNPLVAGEGIRLLRERGIQVYVGLMEADARRLNEAFAKRVTTGLPFVELKVAMSLDGKIATSTGRSQWITGEVARRWVHQRRDRADAVLIGAQTLRADNPQLTVRPAPADGRQPLRCVVTASGNLPQDAALLEPDAETLIFHPEGVRLPPPWAGHGCAIAQSGGHEPAEGLELKLVLENLAQRGVNDVLVEGGARLNAGLLQAGLVDRVSAFVAPKIVGGDAPGGFGELGITDPNAALRLEDLEVQQIGQDWLFRGRPVR
jgi:diaminohydroxyphosphoribosylaminopyrimidine deaminase/5-amino-6-(5-phosphoribosylamino)uracil reductase